MPIDGVGISFWAGFSFGGDAPEAPKPQQKKKKAKMPHLYPGESYILQPDYSYGQSPPKNKYWDGGYGPVHKGPTYKQQLAIDKAAKLLEISQDATMTDQERGDRYHLIDRFGATFREEAYVKLQNTGRQEGWIKVQPPMPLAEKTTA